MQSIEFVFVKDLNHIIHSYLTEIEQIYYGGENEWHRFKEKIFGKYNKYNISTIAASEGWSDLFKWVNKKGDNYCKVYDCYALYTAAKFGHLDILQWVQEVFGIDNYEVGICSSAAEGGHLEILEWMLQNEKDSKIKNNWRNNGICDNAAIKGYLDIINWAVYHECKVSEWTFRRAAKNGHLDILIWGNMNKYNFGDDICYYSFIYNNEEILKWLKINGHCKCTDDNYHKI